MIFGLENARRRSTRRLLLGLALLPTSLASCSRYSENSSVFFETRAEKTFELAVDEKEKEFDVLVDGESLFVDVTGGLRLTLVSPAPPGGTGGSSGGSTSGGSSSGGSFADGGGSFGGLGGLGGSAGSLAMTGGASASGGYDTSTGGYGYGYEFTCPWYDTTSTSVCTGIESSYFNESRRYTFRIERQTASSRIQVIVFARAGSSGSEEGPRSLGVVIDP